MFILGYVLACAMIIVLGPVTMYVVVVPINACLLHGESVFASVLPNQTGIYSRR